MLEDKHRLLSVNLKSIPSVHVGVVHLEYKGNKLPRLVGETCRVTCISTNVTI